MSIPINIFQTAGMQLLQRFFHILPGRVANYLTHAVNKNYIVPLQGAIHRTKCD